MFKQGNTQRIVFSDSRTFRRGDIMSGVKYQLKDGLEILEGATVNLSAGGGCICTKKLFLLPGYKITLNIHFLKTNIIGINGEVVWVKTIEGKNQAGIVFLNAGRKIQNLIAENALRANKIDEESDQTPAVPALVGSALN